MLEALNYTTKTSEEILDELAVSPKSGLSFREALKRQKEFGKNEITAKGLRWYNIFSRQFKSSFIYLLFGAAFLSFVLGQKIDSLMILIFIAINTSLGFYQEYRSEKTLKLLKKYAVSYAKVLRDGREDTVRKEELAPGDIIILETGDKIPADARLIETTEFAVDETILTGESVPILKTDKPIKKMAKEPYEAKNIIFAGTTVVGGMAKAVVLDIGGRTAIGSIAHLAGEVRHQSDFEKNINKFSQFILRLVLVTVFLVFVANIFIKGEQANLITLAIFSIALAVGVIPEALPLVATFSLSRGALHLAKNKVVVRRLSAIEDLGGIEILCADKTGTLTKNILTVDDFAPYSQKELLLYANLAGHFLKKNIDSFDAALKDALSKDEKQLADEYKIIQHIPFNPALRRNAALVLHGKQYELVVRGAAEVILKLCPAVLGKEKKEILEWIKKQGEEGKRVMAIARKKMAMENLEKFENKPEAFIKELEFVGAVSFVDPIKPTTKAALQQAKELGIAVKILTGDSREVAGSVARQVGLIGSPGEVLTGDKFDEMDAREQHLATERYSVFARVSPEQKYKIIKLLQEKYAVGFLGEGINDAPALKIAGVSLVVQSASDVARESSDIVLLEKDLKVIIDGVREGRGIFENTIKYIKTTLASNFGNFFAVAGVSLFINYLPMLPLQILLLNLLSDFPMVAISTDTIDRRDINKPKKYNVKDLILTCLLLGVVSTIFDFIFFGIFVRFSPAVLQTNWFIGSNITEMLLVFLIRSKGFFAKAPMPSLPLLALSVLSILITIILPYTDFGQKIFQFTAPKAEHIALIFIVVGAYLALSEGVKIYYYRNNGA